MKKKIASESEIKKLYEPEAFYEHGDNPAMKKFMQIAAENLKQGRLPNYRIFAFENYTRIQKARNWEDFLQQDMKCITIPRTMLFFTMASIFFGYTTKLARSYLPLGQHGITKISQTSFFHLYGPVGVLFVLALPATGGYLWYKTAKFTAKKIYYHGFMGERNWIYEQEKANPSVNEFYFEDAPWSAEENFPDLARGEMGKKALD